MLDFLMDVMSAVSIGEWVSIGFISLVVGVGGTCTATMLWNKTWYKKKADVFFGVALLQVAIVACSIAVSSGASTLRKTDAEMAVKNAQGSLTLPPDSVFKKPRIDFKSFAKEFVNFPSWQVPYYAHTMVEDDVVAAKLYDLQYRRLFRPSEGNKLSAPDKLAAWLGQSRVFRKLDTVLSETELTALKLFFVRWHYSYARQKHEKTLMELPENAFRVGLLCFLVVIGAVSFVAYKDIENPPISSSSYSRKSHEEE